MKLLIGSPAAMAMEPPLDPPDWWCDDSITDDMAAEMSEEEFCRDGFALAQGLACMVEDGERLTDYATSMRDVDPSEMSPGQLLAFVLSPANDVDRAMCAYELRTRLLKAARDEIKARAAEIVREEQ